MASLPQLDVHVCPANPFREYGTSTDASSQFVKPEAWEKLDMFLFYHRMFTSRLLEDFSRLLLLLVEDGTVLGSEDSATRMAHILGVTHIRLAVAESCDLQSRLLHLLLLILFSLLRFNASSLVTSHRQNTRSFHHVLLIQICHGDSSRVA